MATTSDWKRGTIAEFLANEKAAGGNFEWCFDRVYGAPPWPRKSGRDTTSA